MRFSSLNYRIADLERKLIRKSVFLTLPNGRRFAMPHNGEFRMFCEAMKLAHAPYDLDLSDGMAALVAADPDPGWPPLLRHAHGILTEYGRYSGRDEVFAFLRNKSTINHGQQ